MKEDVRARTRQAQAGGGALALAGLDKIDEANFGAVAHWHPSRSRAQYVLFWTREWAGYRGRDDLGWPLYVPRANMRRIPFDAGHLTMMLEPDVSRLGPLVRREMLTILEAHLGQMRQEVRA